METKSLCIWIPRFLGFNAKCDTSIGFCFPKGFSRGRKNIFYLSRNANLFQFQFNLNLYPMKCEVRNVQIIFILKSRAYFHVCSNNWQSFGFFLSYQSEMKNTSNRPTLHISLGLFLASSIDLASYFSFATWNSV